MREETPEKQRPLRKYGDGLCKTYGHEFAYNPYLDNAPCAHGCGTAVRY